MGGLRPFRHLRRQFAKRNPGLAGVYHFDSRPTRSAPPSRLQSLYRVLAARDRAAAPRRADADVSESDQTNQPTSSATSLLDLTVNIYAHGGWASPASAWWCGGLHTQTQPCGLFVQQTLHKLNRKALYVFLSSSVKMKPDSCSLTPCPNPRNMSAS